MELTLEKLKEDETNLLNLVEQAKAQLYRFDGALSYVKDNINRMENKEEKEEAEDAGKDTDRT